MEKESKQFGLIPREKIFGIGIGKTATKSISVAVWSLGYKKAIHGKGKVLEIVRNLQFWGDIAAASRYKFLDHCFPHAKFILTIRDDVDAWIDSCRRYETYRGSNKAGEGIDLYTDGMIGTSLDRAYNRFLLCGRVNFNEEDFRIAYYKHNAEVREHFRGRKDKLLIMDICAGDGWEKLCPFLGCEIPDRAFPHRHKTKKEEGDGTENTG